MKIQEIREMSVEELGNKVVELKQELFNLRLQKTRTGTVSFPLPVLSFYIFRFNYQSLFDISVGLDFPFLISISLTTEGLRTTLVISSKMKFKPTKAIII